MTGSHAAWNVAGSGMVVVRTAAAVIALAGLLLAAGSDNKKKKPPPKIDQKESQRIKAQEGQIAAARKQIQAAESALREAQQTLAARQAAFREARAVVERLRSQLTARYESAAGVPSAQAARDQAEAAFHRARSPVLEALVDSSPYRAAVGQAEAARKTLQQLRESLQPGEQLPAGQARELADRIAGPTRLEQEAVNADPAARKARTRYEEAARAAAAAREQAHQQVAADRDLVQATAAVAAAASEVDRAETTVTSRRQAVGSAQRKLAQEEAELARLRASARKD